MINGLTDDKAFLESLGVLAWSNVATALLVHPDTGSVRLEVGVIPRDAYGMAVSHELIRISQALLTDPVRMAIVIAHELTHCLDFKFVGSTLRTGGRGWATEINAHFNQGLIMREVYANMSQRYALRRVFDAMAKANTTFGNELRVSAARSRRRNPVGRTRGVGGCVYGDFTRSARCPC